MDTVLVVLSIAEAWEAATGDSLYLVKFGQYIDATPQLLSRIESKGGMKRVSTEWLNLYYKGESVPYMVGSKWRLTVNNDGAVSLVKAQ